MSRRLSPSPTGQAGTPLSNAEAMARLFWALSARVSVLESGADRGPNSSYGLPFILVGPNGNFRFFVNNLGQLCVESPSNTITVIAPP